MIISKKANIYLQKTYNNNIIKKNLNFMIGRANGSKVILQNNVKQEKIMHIFYKIQTNIAIIINFKK